MNKQKPKLLDQLSETMRVKRYSLKTEKSYLHWVRRFIYFHNMRHPREMGAGALNAFAFLYKQVLKIEPELII